MEQEGTPGRKHAWWETWAWAGVIVIGIIGSCFIMGVVGNLNRTPAVQQPVAMPQPAPVPREPPPPPRPPTSAEIWAMEPTADQLIAEPAAMRIMLEGAPAPDDREAQREWPGAVDYSLLNRNPRRHSGTDVTYAGRVVQIMEADNGATMVRVALRPYGQDVLYVITPDPLGVEIREQTRVKVFGRILGEHTYTSQANYQISLPAVVASAVVPR